MINLMKHKELLDEQVEVLCTNGTTVKGEWIDWTSAVDNEPDPESITMKSRKSKKLNRRHPDGKRRLFCNGV